jgi:lysozyme family protein
MTTNAQRWAAMKISAAKGPQFDAVAKRLTAKKDVYKEVEKATGVPWEFVAVTHQRESSQDFGTYLGNGQSLKRKTTIVPKGRGPFPDWKTGAIDALVNAPPKAALNKDWSIGGTLDKLEEYNGLGYRRMGKPSPYLWAGTDQYVKGKYVADHKYDPNHVDTQLGCAGLLKFMGWKKDNVSGPAATAVVIGTATATFWDTIVAHPYLSAMAIAAVGGAVWFVVHKIRNRK